MGFHSLDINDCAKRPCKNGGRCVDKVNSYQCICKAGYNGVKCENGKRMPWVYCTWIDLFLNLFVHMSFRHFL
jgi:hypothetical protein